MRSTSQPFQSLQAINSNHLMPQLQCCLRTLLVSKDNDDDDDDEDDVHDKDSQDSIRYYTHNKTPAFDEESDNFPNNIFFILFLVCAAFQLLQISFWFFFNYLDIFNSCLSKQKPHFRFLNVKFYTHFLLHQNRE